MDTRRAHPDDWLNIEMLNQQVRRTTPRLWWWEEHLTCDSFIVTEHKNTTVGALFAWPDESPVAWVRLATLDDGMDIDEWLDQALPPVLSALRRQGTQALAWMDHDGWAGLHLRRRGFQRLTDVVTLIKSDHTLPKIDDTDAQLRPAAGMDIPAVVTIDRAAFTPHWWHSEATMRRRAAASSYFAVAERAGELVAYAEGTLHPPKAHLNRIAVHPAHQHRGIGARLLHNTLHTFWQHGAEQVTLNTQTANRLSQRLYHRFGFEPTGDLLTAWEMRL